MMELKTWLHLASPLNRALLDPLSETERGVFPKIYHFDGLCPSK